MTKYGDCYDPVHVERLGGRGRSFKLLMGGAASWRLGNRL